MRKTMAFVLVGVMLIAFVLGLTGAVSLSNSSSLGGHEPDWLVGVYITREYLDLWENDQKLYAKRVQTEEPDGYTYVFEGVEGVPFFLVREMLNGERDYWNLCSDGGISDGHQAINVSDTGEGISLEGTLYLSTEDRGDVFCYNPVYQTADGEVYVTTGNSFGIDMIKTPETNFSSKITESSTMTVDGESKLYDFSVEVHITYMDPPSTYRLLQFDKDHQLLKVDEIDPERIPETFAPLKEASYLMLETTRTGREGNYTSYELYQKSDVLLRFYHVREDMVCASEYCDLVWDE
ncbi:MAG: hypothetical protein IJ744_09885 [Lachnospiraceae bacterium]|nr:hypothetical protein [Lachnospiraceae bacterium]